MSNPFLPSEDKWKRVESIPTRKHAYGPVSDNVSIETREGTMTANPGDYIMRESDGNMYPIDPDKFKKYYRVVENE